MTIEASAGPFDYRLQLENEALEKKLAEVADRNAGDCVILFADRREGHSGYLIVLISPASAWHPLLPQRQIAEIRDREPTTKRI